MRQGLWHVIVEGKIGLGKQTLFEFKYIPELSKKTKREDAVVMCRKRLPAKENKSRMGSRTLWSIILLATLSIILLALFVKAPS